MRMFKTIAISTILSAVVSSASAASLGLTIDATLAEGTGDGILLYDSGFGVLSEDFTSAGSLGIFSGAQAGSGLTLSLGSGIDAVGIEGTAISATISQVGFSDDTLELLLSGDLLSTGDTVLLMEITQQNPAFDFSGATETSGAPFSIFSALPTDFTGVATLNNIGFTISTLAPITPIPLPASLLLLGGGMLGVFGTLRTLGRRRSEGTA